MYPFLVLTGDGRLNRQGDHRGKHYSTLLKFLVEH